MANAETIAKARRSLSRELGNALDKLGENLVDLGTRISDDDLEPEARATDLFSQESRDVWAAIWQSEVRWLSSALEQFDAVVKGTENGAQSRYEIVMDRDNFEGEAGPEKLHNLIGKAAIVKRFLEKADFNIAVTREGMRVCLVCSR